MMEESGGLAVVKGFARRGRCGQRQSGHWNSVVRRLPAPQHLVRLARVALTRTVRSRFQSFGMLCDTLRAQFVGQGLI